MTKRTRAPFLALLLLLAGIAGAHAESDRTGKQVFDQHCSHCHNPGPEHPGTFQLARTRGQDKAVLEQRGDLAAEYVKVIVRNGLNAMPPFKPSNITGEELEALADYLAR